jgi:hypothetical protein
MYGVHKVYLKRLHAACIHLRNIFAITKLLETQDILFMNF